jgi:hypothetical protein
VRYRCIFGWEIVRVGDMQPGECGLVVSGTWRGVEFEFDERGCVGEATRGGWE